jgi:hypothetical protein
MIGEVQFDMVEMSLLSPLADDKPLVKASTKNFVDSLGLRSSISTSK